MAVKKPGGSFKPEELIAAQGEISRTALKRAKKLIKSRELGALLITSREGVRYLSGFTGTDATLLITSGKPLLLTDSRYTEQAKVQASKFNVITYRKKFDAIGDELNRLKNKKVGFEARHMVTNSRSQIEKGLQSGAKLIPLETEIEGLRKIKIAPELAFLKKAAKLSETGLYKAMEMIKPGVRERDIALEMEFVARRNGAEDKAFDFIVASGVRGAMPHGVASDKKIRRTEMITIDFGVTFNGYASDETATIALGKPKAEMKKIYDVVRTAQKIAIEGIKPGAVLKEVDALARDYIAQAGYGKYFGHGLGHGVGVAVHEEPNLSPLSKGKLEAGMVVTVEPGIYIPGLGGVRVEDMIHVTDGGAELITNFNKELTII